MRLFYLIKRCLPCNFCFIHLCCSKLILLRYNEIAKFGFTAMGRDGHNVLEPLSQDDPTTASDNSGSTEKPAGLGR